MGNYLKRKGKDVGRYIVEGPYMVPTLPLDTLVVAILGGGNNVGQVKREP